MGALHDRYMSLITEFVPFKMDLTTAGFKFLYRFPRKFRLKWLYFISENDLVSSDPIEFDIQLTGAIQLVRFTIDPVNIPAGITIVSPEYSLTMDTSLKCNDGNLFIRKTADQAFSLPNVTGCLGLCFYELFD